MSNKVRLSVNINKVALIRNARGESQPDIFKFAQKCEEYGAEGITVHPRPDERHIRWSDLEPLKSIVNTEFNIEGYPSDRFLDEVLQIQPHQATLVPDPPGALTSNTGWDTRTHHHFLSEVISELKSAGIRVSIFLNAEPDMVEYAARSTADRIELYTGGFAKDFAAGNERGIFDHIETAAEAAKCGLGVNAGHDLDLKNLAFYASRVPNLLEVSIGHALVCDALYYGISNTVQMYQHQLDIAARIE